MYLMIPYLIYIRVGFKHAENIKDGIAMLVMRNFGYLGLHSALHTSSTLARDRVVDFTGDLQVRRRYPNEIIVPPDNHNNNSNNGNDGDDDDGRVYIAPSWHTDFIGEPTVNGGRNFVGSLSCLETDDDHHPNNKNNKNSNNNNSYSNSALYTQEVAPLPLSITQPATRQPRISVCSTSSSDLLSLTGTVTTMNNNNSTSSGSDAESFFYTSLCNELLCHPRILHQLGCAKRNISIKIEVRRLTFNERLHSYVATLPRSGPSLHNTRRGAFLVNELYTACAYHCLDPHFLDEFKIKLPLVYSGSGSSSSDNGDDDDGGGGKLVALFSAYNVRVKERKRSRFFRRNHHYHHDVPSEDGSEEVMSSSPIELLGCGYLPLFTDGDVPCLISNGLHDVKLKYMPKPMVAPMMENTTTASTNTTTSDYDPDTLILEPLSFLQDTSTTAPQSSPPSQSDNFGANFGSRFWRSDSASVTIEDCINAVVAAPNHHHLTNSNNNTNNNTNSKSSQHTSSEDDTSTSDTFSCFTTTPSEPMLSSSHHHFRTAASPSPVSSIADSISSKWNNNKDRDSFGTIQSSMGGSRSRKGSKPMVLQVSVLCTTFNLMFYLLWM